jgi:alkylation response protein AidB-like acyl-CoA dehydrogenase
MPYVAVKATEGQVRENWNPVGLRGTVSHDFVVEKLVVPRERIVWLLGGEQGENRHRYSPLGHSVVLITLAAAAVQIGVARHALDLARDYLLRKSGQPVFEGALIDDPTLFIELARQEAEWELCNAAMEMACARWDEALSSGGGLRYTRVSSRQVSVAAIHKCAEIVGVALRLGGSEASTRGARLEQCFRDGSVLTTHVAGRARLLSTMLRVQLGQATPWDLFAL